MAGKVLKLKSLHLTNFVPNRKVSAYNPATDTYTHPLYAMQKSQRANRHIWFLPTHMPNAKNQKSLFFCPRLDRPTMKRTKCILKNEINEKFGLF